MYSWEEDSIFRSLSRFCSGVAVVLWFASRIKTIPMTRNKPWLDDANLSNVIVVSE